MTDVPGWLPELLTLRSVGGQWPPYEAAVYAAFKYDFMDNTAHYYGMRIGLRRHPMYNNREWAFWHVTQEGDVEEERIPDLRRCERIGWIRAIIENAEDDRVLVWENERRGNRRILLWLESLDYLVVLGVRNRGYAMLVTAYPTNRPHTRRKLWREYKDSRK